MSRFLCALVLGFSALAASSQAQAQPDRYLFVPDRSACCQDPLVRVVRRPVSLIQPVVQPQVVRRERHIYVSPPPSVALRPLPPPRHESRLVLSLVSGFRRPVLQTGEGTGVVAGARIAGDFGWSTFGLRFDFTHFADEDEYRTALEWRFIARQHEMFRPYASFAPGFTARSGPGATRFGFGVESELGLLMNHDTTHGALQVSIGVTGSAAYLPANRRSLVDVGVRASLGFAFAGSE